MSVTSRVVVLFAPASSHLADAPLRLAVPCVPDAEPLLLEAVRAVAPAGATEVEVELVCEGPEGELALLDYWTDLPSAERARVWAVAGAMAGVLARFGDRPSMAFAVVADAGALDARPINAQTRSLLMSVHADTWMLAVDCGPEVDADVWRARLRTVVRERWCVGRLHRPSEALEQLGRTWQVDAAHLAPVAALARHTEAAPASAACPAGWLDAELDAMLREKEDALHVAPRSPDASATSSAQDDAPRALRGKRSRLFLGNDSHDSHRQIVGGRQLTAAELDAWERGTAARVAWLSERGCRFAHLIGPAPQVVHADDLPGTLAPSPSRPVRQLLDRLQEMVPPPPVLYPLDALAALRTVHAPFSLTDSHWNDLGAFVAYEALLASLDGVRLRRIHRDEVAFHETVYVGDLGSKVYPERASVFLRARLDEPRARIVEDNRVRNHGRRVVYECASAPDTTCIVFGDSWAYPMMLFLAETFRRTVFLHRVNVVDRRPVEVERPDVVLVVMTERFCDTVPDDARAADFEALAAKKIRKGDLVPPQQAGQRYEYLYSLALDRQLRERPAIRLSASSLSGTAPATPHSRR